MNFRLLSPELVEAIHDAVLNPGELPGRARDKSLEAALARVDNRLAYGMVADAFVVARKVVSCVARVGQRWGVAHVAAVLEGKATPQVSAFHSDSDLKKRRSD